LGQSSARPGVARAKVTVARMIAAGRNRRNIALAHGGLRPCDQIALQAGPQVFFGPIEQVYATLFHFDDPCDHSGTLAGTHAPKVGHIRRERGSISVPGRA
jgi:hypothetical protein